MRTLLLHNPTAGAAHPNADELVRQLKAAGFLEAVPQPTMADSTEFVCVGRLSAQKGLPLLIAACDRLRAGGEAFTLTIVGDGEMRAELEAEIASEETRLREMEVLLASPDLYRDGDRVKETTRVFEETKVKLAQLYEHWEEAIELK